MPAERIAQLGDTFNGDGLCDNSTEDTHWRRSDGTFVYVVLFSSIDDDGDGKTEVTLYLSDSSGAKLEEHYPLGKLIATWPNAFPDEDIAEKVDAVPIEKNDAMGQVTL